MATYVLVHGAWIGAWAWDRIIPLLQQAGHTVVAPDLPGHGADNTPVPQISLQSYTERITSVVDTQPDPVILVGHSMGGTVISQVAEARPEKIRTLVYLSGWLLQSGQSVLQMSAQDTESLIGRNLDIDEARGVAALRPDAIPQIFYNDCSAEDAAWGTARMQADPLRPLVTPVSVSEDRFGRVPRVYISMLLDHAVGPAMQKRMYTALPCQVVTLEAGHGSFLCAAQTLAAQLNAVPEMVAVQA